MAYTWDKADATGQRVTQYFEMFGARAIYHDGWIASTHPASTPWIITLGKPPADVMNSFAWELYNLNEDWTQGNNLAQKMPDKLRGMQQLFTLEAHPMPRSLPITIAWDEYFNVGVDTGTSVDNQDYEVPFRFTGKIDKLTVKLGRNE
jgi:hypothetical protein